MTKPDQWRNDNHTDIVGGPQCRDVNKKTSRVCNLHRGHDGAHAWVWRRIDPGRVRESW